MLASRVVAAALLLNDLSNLITCTFISITCTACVIRHGNGSSSLRLLFTYFNGEFRQLDTIRNHSCAGVKHCLLRMPFFEK